MAHHRGPLICTAMKLACFFIVLGFCMIVACFLPDGSDDNDIPGESEVKDPKNHGSE